MSPGKVKEEHNMKILHASDLHGKPLGFMKLAWAAKAADVIVITGDMLPSSDRVVVNGMNRMLPRIEIAFQEDWVKHTISKMNLPYHIGDTPVICVDGNHDFLSVATVLKEAGVKNVYELDHDNLYVDLLGKRWAGFRDIPFMKGEWMGETHDFNDLVTQTFACQPDILLTHAPPAGILSDVWGITKLTSFLQFQPHNVKAHFFGHVHRDGGKTMKVMDTLHINGSQRVLIHDIDV
jgi:Icc-related predicted phosphoesterase